MSAVRKRVGQVVCDLLDAAPLLARCRKSVAEHRDAKSARGASEVRACREATLANVARPAAAAVSANPAAAGTQ